MENPFQDAMGNREPMSKILLKEDYLSSIREKERERDPKILMTYSNLRSEEKGEVKHVKHTKL